MRFKPKSSLANTKRALRELGSMEGDGGSGCNLLLECRGTPKSFGRELLLPSLGGSSNMVSELLEVLLEFKDPLT